MDSCVICKDSITQGGETVTLREKGAESINNASKQRGDEIEARPGFIVHKVCRLDYTNSKIIELYFRNKGEVVTEPKRLLRSEMTFNFKSDCIFCGKQPNQNSFMKKVK